jgi:hypothetical protein
MTAMLPLDKSTFWLGRTIRWTCTDGPVAGRTFEHRFDQRERGPAAFITVVPIDKDIVVVSHLAKNGQALMATLNFADQQMSGFILSRHSWTRQKGRFELLSPPS